MTFLNQLLVGWLVNLWSELQVQITMLFATFLLNSSFYSCSVEHNQIRINVFSIRVQRKTRADQRSSKTVPY